MLTPPVADAANYLYDRGGTIRFAKETMVNAEAQFVDAHPEDAFDFSLAHYHDQLVAGYSKNAPAGGLVAYLPDFWQINGKTVAPDLRPSDTAGGAPAAANQ